MKPSTPKSRSFGNELALLTSFLCDFFPVDNQRKVNLEFR